MQKYISEPTHLIVLERGADLFEELTAVAKDLNLKCAWVSILGGASSTTMGFYDPDMREYIWSELNEPLQINDLQANLTIVDGEPFWHVHGTFGRRDFSVVGGHITACQIDPLAEIAITPIDADVTREFNEELRLFTACPMPS